MTSKPNPVTEFTKFYVGPEYKEEIMQAFAEWVKEADGCLSVYWGHGVEDDKIVYFFIREYLIISTE